MTRQTGRTAEAVDRPPSAGPSWLAQQLQDKILSDELPNGSMLPSSRELAERYNLSRPAVREALRSLSERQLIEIVPGRGAFVRKVTPTDAAGQVGRLLMLQSVTPRDLVEARVMIEGRAAALAAERATEDDLDELVRILAEFDASSDVRQRARLDVAFHLGIARAAHNRVIETMFGSISMLAEELIVRSLSDGTVSREGLPIHREILDALRRRDGEAAADAAVRHLAVAERHYGADYDRTLDQLVRVPTLTSARPG